MVSPDQASWIVATLEQSNLGGQALRAEAMLALSRLPGYDWCGVYRLESDGLHLDEYTGAPTNHTHIPVGRGVCGTAVAENRNQIVGDVRQLENYLACSLETRSEIVVLIKDAHGSTLGQIDIDGHEPSAFDRSDETMLERIGDLLADRWDN
jgi:GAF domain-containing protein